MKLKLLFTIFISFFISLNCNAQLLVELKQLVNEKGLETCEVSCDSASYNEHNDHSDDKGFVIESAHDFFTKNVVMDLFNKDGQLVLIAYFDADVIAMRAPKGFDPTSLLELEEDALLMEVIGTDKKKKNQSFTMTAISLEQNETAIKKNNYQIMNMGGF